MKQVLNNRIALSLIGGLLLSISWWEHSTGLIMLVAFLPFLQVLRLSSEKNKQPSNVFSIIFPGFLLFNLLTFSWLSKASPVGGGMAILAHSLMATTVFWLVYKISAKASKFTSAISFVSIWLAYEQLCLNVDIISPWLNIGNVFGKEPALIQWYEYLGSGGGSLWVLLINILIFRILIKYQEGSKYRLLSVITFLCIAFPLIASLIIFSTYDEEFKSSSIVIVQPNIDPYSEKFDSLSFIDQFENMLLSGEEALKNEVEWMILPETSIDDPFFEREWESNRYMILAFDLLKRNNKLNLVIGATTKSPVEVTSQIKSNRKKIERSLPEYRLFNSAVHLANEVTPSYYHKSKLVPGIEKSVSILPKFLERIIIPDLGGSMSGYNVQKDREVFTHSVTGTRIAPIICYESAYGEYTTEYVRKGAEILVIITNDGWWDKTPAYKQHLWFASLRAIENRRSIIRSANTGISCTIDQRGVIKSSTSWWEKDVIIGDVSKNSILSFYTINGDLVYKFSTFTAIILLILSFVAAPIRKMVSE